MGQILHGCAKTTQTIRRAIQNRKESIAKLSKHYNLNPKTIIKWRKRSFTKDADMGPKRPRSTVLTLGSVDKKYEKREKDGSLA